MDEADSLHNSRSTTPIKTVRSRRSSGGLTPLPAEQPLSKDGSSTYPSDNQTIPPRSEMTHDQVVEISIKDTQKESDLNQNNDSEMSKKISCGLKKIQELDEILALKSKIAKDLNTDRIRREGTPDCSDSGNTPDNESHITFYNSREKVGKDQLLKKTSSKVSVGKLSFFTQVTPTLSGYDTGNFVQRNIVLGKDARYYHAMSQVECVRVENILENPEFDDVTADYFTIINRPQSALSGFYPDPKDLSRLVEIDKELQKIVPESDWETKSLTWSSTMPSGATTPLSSIRQPIKVDTVLESLSYELSLNHERIKEIDERLNELQNTIISDDVTFDPKQLELLISQTLLEEKKHILIN